VKAQTNTTILLISILNQPGWQKQITHAFIAHSLTDPDSAMLNLFKAHVIVILLLLAVSLSVQTPPLTASILEIPRGSAFELCAMSLIYLLIVTLSSSGVRRKYIAYLKKYPVPGSAESLSSSPEL